MTIRYSPFGFFSSSTWNLYIPFVERGGFDFNSPTASSIWFNPCSSVNAGGRVRVMQVATINSASSPSNNSHSFAETRKNYKEIKEDTIWESKLKNEKERSVRRTLELGFWRRRSRAERWRERRELKFGVWLGRRKLRVGNWRRENGGERVWLCERWSFIVLPWRGLVMALEGESIYG